MRLARLLAGQGDLDGLRARADIGDGEAPAGWSDLLASRRDLGGLRARAKTATGRRHRLADLLADRGDLDQRGSCAASPTQATRKPQGSWTSYWPSAGTWTAAPRPRRRRRQDAAIGWLTCWPTAGTWTEPTRSCAASPTRRREAAWKLAELLAERGDLDQLRSRADAGDQEIAWWLADLLADRGDLDEAAQLLARRRRRQARRPWLADLLAERGDLDELRGPAPIPATRK